MRIVEYTSTDVEPLLPCIVSYKRECKVDEFGLDAEPIELVKTLIELIEGEDSTLFVLMDNDSVVGFIGVMTGKFPFSQKRYGCEYYWYILPPYRGVSSMRLFRAAVEWSKQRGCSHFISTASRAASSLYEKVVDIYESIGMKHYASDYIMDIGG
jgi:GNAT superfamily N-acetyltransferase